MTDEHGQNPRTEEPAPLSPDAPAAELGDATQPHDVPGTLGAPEGSAAADPVVEKVDAGATNAAAAVDSGAHGAADTVGAKASEAADAISAKASEAAGAVSARAAGVVDAVSFKAAGPASSVQSTTDDRPETLIGGAFAGGFLLALILKRLGR